MGRKGEGEKLHAVDEQDDVLYLAEVKRCYECKGSSQGNREVYQQGTPGVKQTAAYLLVATERS